jgi:NAD(P)-dependent dehydrogenase (short-subunit alcohol dehydrogenase family)
MGRLENKVAVITGAASGIGAATVRAFAADGAKILAADVQVAKGEAVAAEVGASFVRHDVSDPSSWKNLEALVETRFGQLDVMFNNAGIAANQDIETVDLETWNRVLAINLTGVMLGSQTAIRLMKRNPGGSSGSIINTASTVSFVGIPQDLAYTATKGAVRAMTKSIAVYGARGLNIRCNSLVPGATRTGLLQPFLELDPRAEENVKSMSPMHRIGEPRELAAMVVFLASDESSFCTGAEFVVDGGMLCAHPGM